MFWESKFYGSPGKESSRLREHQVQRPLGKNVLVCSRNRELRVLTPESQVLGRFVWLWYTGQMKKERRQIFLVVTNLFSFYSWAHRYISFPDSFKVWCSHVAEFRPMSCNCKWYELIPGLVYRDNHMHSSLSLHSCSNPGDGMLW